MATAGRSAGRVLRCRHPSRHAQHSSHGNGAWSRLVALALCIIVLPSSAEGSSSFPTGDRPHLYLSDVSANGYRRSVITGTHAQYPSPTRAIQLQCAAPGTAQYVRNTVWMVRGEVITDNSLHIADDIDVHNTPVASRLVMYGVSINASGMYRCYQTCVDRQGRYFLAEGHKLVRIITRDVFFGAHLIERGAHLTVAYGPVTVVEGSTFRLQCHGRSASDDGITFWEYNNRHLRPKGQRVQRSFSFGWIQFNPARVEDSGNYRCLVQNTFNGQSADFQLTVLPASAQLHLGAITVILQGPNDLRQGKSAIYVCAGLGTERQSFDIAWSVPDGYRVNTNGHDEINVTNVNATVKQESRMSCTVRGPDGAPQARAWSMIQITSQPPLLPGPRMVRYKPARHFFRVRSSRSTEESVKAQVTGICIRLSTTTWNWNRTLVLSYDEIRSEKIFFTELVHDRTELLQHIFNTELTIKVAYMDSFGPGEWYSTAVNISTLPVAPGHVTATLIPGQSNAARIQWEYPGVPNKTLSLDDRQHFGALRLNVMYNNLASGQQFNSWTPAVVNQLTDTSRSRSTVLSNLTIGGIYRFRIWWSVNGRVTTRPLRARTIVSLLQADITATSRQTRNIQVAFAVKGTRLCSVQNLRTATGKVAAHLVEHVNSLCTECQFEDIPSIDIRVSPGDCSLQPTSNTVPFEMSVHTRATVYAGRSFCDLLANIRNTFVRDSRSVQIIEEGVGVLSITLVCGPVGNSGGSRVFGCLQQRQARPSETPSHAERSWYVRSASDPTSTAHLCTGLV